MADYRCDFCWTTFDSPVELMLHEAAEDDRLYEVPGLTSGALEERAHEVR